MLTIYLLILRSMIGRVNCIFQILFTFLFICVKFTLELLLIILNLFNFENVVIVVEI